MPLPALAGRLESALDNALMESTIELYKPSSSTDTRDLDRAG